MRILMVCLGNICRSPLAEGLLQFKSDKLNLRLEIDSAGMHGLHAGELPHPKSVAIAQKHGIDITYQKSRKINTSDLDYFDLILAMDKENISELKRLTNDLNHLNKIQLIMEYAGLGTIEVPDPYYDGRYALVYEMLDEATDGVIGRLKEKLCN
jgi:protein-tyrosine phosphatase